MDKKKTAKSGFVGGFAKSTIPKKKAARKTKKKSKAAKRAAEWGLF